MLSVKTPRIGYKSCGTFRYICSSKRQDFNLTQDTDDWHFATSSQEIPLDEALPVDIESVEIALCKIDDTVYALSNICTHEYACMSDGFIDGEFIECPLHQARFHIPTGKVTSPPANVDLKTFRVKVINNDVYVQIPK